MSAKHDITAENLRLQNARVLHAGDDYDHQFTIERPPGTPLDLTSATIWFTIKRSARESDNLAGLQLSTSDAAEIQITDPTVGKFTIKFRGSGTKTTENLAGIWKYDISAKLGDTTLITLATGVIEFLENITRSIA